MLKFLKERLAGFLTWHVVGPVLRQQREAIFQQLVDRDLSAAGLRNDYYPVGAAASYALLYLIIRIIRENYVGSIVELGSGESTRLIDSIKRPGTAHVCYEHHSGWYETLQGRLATCDYRLRPLVPNTLNGVEYEWYQDVELVDFDLLLVDGPVGVDRLSRIGCWKLIEANRKRDFVIVIDDCCRRGEFETLSFLQRELNRRGLSVYTHRLDAGNVPGVVCCGRYSHVRFYF